MKTILYWLVRLLYGFRAYNTDVLRTPGPVLLLPNHVSWWDWIFLGACLDDDWRFVTSRTAAERNWIFRRVMINRRTFPVDMNSPYAVKHMAEYLQKGGRLVLFPEGRLSRTGSLMKLFDGTGFLIFKTHARVITSTIRGAARLPFSPNPNRKRWFPRVSVHFSDARTAPQLSHPSASESRERMTDWLLDQMIRQQFEIEMEFGPRTVPAAVVETARIWPRLEVLQDASMQSLTYRKLLLGADLLSAQWTALFAPDSTRAGAGSRGAAVPAPGPGPAATSSGAMDQSADDLARSHDSGKVGVLLPNVNAMPVTLLSLWAAGKVPAILNYTSGPGVLLACTRLAGLRHVITSRRFLERAGIDVGPLAAAGVTLVYLEDVRARISGITKIAGLIRTVLLGPGTARRTHAADETAVVLFTSGSEGDPKGVELTHRNLLANIRQMLSVVDLVDQDRFFNALPLFHSFGLTVGLLLPLVRGLFAFLYLSPLHYRVVPSALYNLDCTVFFGTNTFLTGYARKAHPFDFRTVRYLFAGAEKLQENTTNIWMRKFGVRIIEGYGATECSPCLSANTPVRPRHGSAGRFLPGIEHRLEPVPGVAEGGRLFVRGPNIMRGYLNPGPNAAFRALGGWYDTGDIVTVDKAGFVFIQGRLKRFAKVSGEMVSLTAVEEALAGAFPQYGIKFAAAVIAISDAAKGERLVAISNEPRLTLEQVRDAVKARGLGNLAAPRELRVLHELPRLGTGKVNHRELERVIRDGR